ncbi:hypothetical protein HDU76_001537 [Blyttiomyces sp. JEL0837]|nr:hypothetical protein HDU76_001537 [Blyttiomyces sp. JEL0837]
MNNEFTDEGFEEQALPVFASRWNEEQRGEFAFQLLLTVSSSTLASVTSRLTPLLQRDFMSLLPFELAIHILSFTDNCTLGRAARVSKKWKQVACDNSVWRTLYRRKGWGVNEQFLASWNQSRSNLSDRPHSFKELSTMIPVDDDTNGMMVMTAESSSGRSNRKGMNENNLAMASGASAGAVNKQNADYYGRPPLPAGWDGVQQMEIDNDSFPLAKLQNPRNDPALSIYESRTTDSWDNESQRQSYQLDVNSASTSSSSAMQIVHHSESQAPLPGLLSSNQQQQVGGPSSLLSDGSLFDAGIGSSHEMDEQEDEAEGADIEDIRNIYWSSTGVEAIYCLQFDEDKIVSGSRDNTIKFWDMKTSECKRTLKGHQGSVLCLHYVAEHLVRGSAETTIIVWRMTTGEILRTLAGHTESVLNLRFDSVSRKVVSCSIDKTIKIWKVDTGQLLLTLKGHRAAVNAFQCKNGLIVSGRGDRQIKVWNMETGKLIRTLSGHTRGIACIQFDGNIIVSGSSDKTIKIWDVHGALLNTLHGHTDLVRTLQFDSERIVSGSYDQTLKVWDMKTGNLLLDMKNGHTSRVFKLQFNEAKIVSCSQDQASYSRFLFIMYLADIYVSFSVS